MRGAALSQSVEPFDSVHREPFSPRGFLRGEKVPKADEGGVYARCEIKRRWPEADAFTILQVRK